MSIESYWDDEVSLNTIVCQYNPGWTWNDVHKHDQETLIPMIESVDHDVALVVDMRTSGRLDYIGFVDQVVKSANTLHPYTLEIVIFVLNQSDIGNLLEVAFRKYGKSARLYLMVKTMDEARALIANFRQHR